MSSLSPTGLLGRGIAAIGAVLSAVSLFPEAFTDGISYWDGYERMDIIILVLAVVAFLFLLLSVAALEIFFLFGVGAIGGFGLGLFSQALIEFSGDAGLGAYLANGGSAAMVAGALIALIPAMLGRPKQREEYAFLPPETAREPAPSPPPPVEAEPEAAAPATEQAAAPATAAGWYADPAGQARLRYWDGQAWTEQTQE